MKITILAIGRMKSGPEKTLCDNYLHRLPWTTDIRELDVRKTLPAPEKQQRESELLRDAIPDGAVIVTMDEHGKTLTSPQLAEKLGGWQDDGRKDIVFLIGGADGHTDLLKNKADLLLSMGKMTWPHMLARVMLTEQLYRAWSILTNHPYHRG